MCGIYFKNQPDSISEVKARLNKIKYRGPDNLSVLKKDNLVFGHLRLSILDLDERANQPYSYKNLTLIFNGEIYNYKKLKEKLIGLGYTFETLSDTEILIKSYDYWGFDVTKKLNGMFSFIIYDSDKKLIFASRDRLGKKPLYYTKNEDSIELCSQIQPLEYNSFKLNEKSIKLYLLLGYIPSPFSIYDGLFKLEPGHNLIYDLKTKTLKKENYWDLEEPKITKKSYEKIKSKVLEKIITSTKLRLYSDVPLGFFLSSGIDSTLITAVASKILDQKINTYTVKFDIKEFDESNEAEKISRVLGSNHTTINCSSKDALDQLEILINNFDEPFSDPSSLPSLLIAKKMKEKATVVISGDGGDESFFGYNHFNFYYNFYRFLDLNYSLRKYVSHIFKLIRLKGAIKFSNFLLLRNRKEFIEKIFTSMTPISEYKNNLLTEFHSASCISKNPMQSLADFNIKLWLINNNNYKLDRTGMINSLEIRSPLMDFNIIEYARRIPLKFKFKKRVKKYILKDILKDLIPEYNFGLKKKGFGIPLEHWLKNQLKEEVLNTLTPRILKKVNFLDKQFYHQMNLFYEGKNNNYSRKIWRVYILVRWLENKGFI